LNELDLKAKLERVKALVQELESSLKEAKNILRGEAHE